LIDIPEEDRFFKGEFIDLKRSEFEKIDGVREQINFQTSWLDGSALYGVDRERLDLLLEADGINFIIVEDTVRAFNLDPPYIRRY
jgi:hypothetical protein